MLPLSGLFNFLIKSYGKTKFSIRVGVHQKLKKNLMLSRCHRQSGVMTIFWKNDVIFQKPHKQLKFYT